MAALTETPNLVVSPEVDYSAQKVWRHGDTVFNIIKPNNYGVPIVLQNANPQTTFNLPPDVFNLFKSYLYFKVYLPRPAAGSFIWRHSDTLAEIQQIQFFPNNNQWVVDANYLPNYLKSVFKHETSLTDFLTMDPLLKICPSNTVVNTVPALRPAPGNDAVPSSVNYFEPAYSNVGVLSVNGAAGPPAILPTGTVEYTVMFPLSLIKNSFFSVNKNFYFGDTMYLRLFANMLNKIAWQSTQNANPNADVENYVPAPRVAVLNDIDVVPKITDLTLYLATETNIDERRLAIQRFQTGHVEYIPYILPFVANNSGISQSINVQLNSGMGMNLQKMYWQLNNINQVNNTAYDISNNNGSKVRSYYTQLNSVREQNINVECVTEGPFTDYMLQHQSLKGSMCLNRNVFQYNWHHLSDYSQFTNEYVHEGKTDLVSGYQLTAAPLTWTFLGLNTADTNFMHYGFGIFTKKLIIGKGSVTVQ